MNPIGIHDGSKRAAQAADCSGRAGQVSRHATTLIGRVTEKMLALLQELLDRRTEELDASLLDVQFVVGNEVLLD